MTETTAGVTAYRAARDLLVRHREDYTALESSFTWPDVGSRFNWATDWFDVVAQGNSRTALRIVGDDGSDESYSFAEMAERSDRVATWLEATGGLTLR